MSQFRARLKSVNERYERSLRQATLAPKPFQQLISGINFTKLYFNQKKLGTLSSSNFGRMSIQKQQTEFFY
jgi:hypothetical protein